MQLFLYLVAVLSGIAGLGYQITWSRMFSVGLGHELPSVLASITAFFGGLALGGWLLDRRIATSKNPAWWYIGIELLIAIWALATAWLIPLANQQCFYWIGENPTPLWQWTVAFAVPLVTLLPATTAMGATLPAMDRLAAQWTSKSRMIGGLYGANTIGAMLGTILSAHWINPSLGYRSSLFLMAGLNIGCAMIVAGFYFLTPLRHAETRDIETRDIETRDIAPPREASSNSAIRLGNLLWIAFTTGLLGIGYEVVGIRTLGAVYSNTVYSYASTLAVFLAGTGLGGWVYQVFFRSASFEKTLGTLLVVTMSSCLIGSVVLGEAHSIYFFFRDRWGNLPAAEIAVSAFAFTLPTISMGALFSHLAQSAKRADGGVGMALAVNTIGASFAPIVFGVLLIPIVGIKICLLILSLSYLGLILFLSDAKWAQASLALGLFGLVLGIVLVNPKTLLMKPGQTLVVQKAGMMAGVGVVANSNGKRGLRVNNHFNMGGTQNPQFERIQGILPIVLHPHPKSALFLGIGTGITLGAATTEPEIQVTGVELVQEIIDVLPLFSPENRDVHQHPRVQIRNGDARRFIRATQQKFDVVTGDLFHPGRDGAGSLYTVEHFAAIKNLLNEGGLACAWIPSYQMDEEVFKTVLRSYLEVFPGAVAWCGLINNSQLMAIALVSDNRVFESHGEWLQQRNLAPEIQRELDDVGLKNDVQLLGHYVADNSTLRKYAGVGEINRDDLPLVTYRAPKYVYERYRQPWERCQQLLQLSAEKQVETLSRISEPQRTKLAAYWQGRDQLFQANTLTGKSKTDGLLKSMELTEEFPDAYLAAVDVARKLQQEGFPKQAMALLKKVLERRPEGTEAKWLLGELEKK